MSYILRIYLKRYLGYFKMNINFKKNPITCLKNFKQLKQNIYQSTLKYKVVSNSP